MPATNYTAVKVLFEPTQVLLLQMYSSEVNTSQSLIIRTELKDFFAKLELHFLSQESSPTNKHSSK